MKKKDKNFIYKNKMINKSYHMIRKDDSKGDFEILNSFIVQKDPQLGKLTSNS
jgi:hypothetical protein